LRFNSREKEKLVKMKANKFSCKLDNGTIPAITDARFGAFSTVKCKSINI
jgi:hypothetical protein